MRQVIKREEPSSFHDWKALANDEWTPYYGDLQNPEKRDLTAALIREQGGLCCYCGRPITADDSHVEHFRPQESFPNLALNFDNLLASCIRQQKPTHPIHCGHAKGRWFIETLAISPLESNCEQRFSYQANGEIDTNDVADEAAETMIDKLNLREPYLRNRREEALSGIFDTEFLGSATSAELQTIADAYGACDANDLEPFAQVICRYAQQLIGDTGRAGAEAGIHGN